MVDITRLVTEKEAFIFELDNVLYPEQDYLLQVYYLFANFLEYTETRPEAALLTRFLKEEYLSSGSEGLFSKAAREFDIDGKYEDNFNRLHVSAQPPLLLYFYPEMLRFLKYCKAAGKSLFLLTRGNPLMQLNKLKYIDWQGIDKEIKVYFYDEIKLLTHLEPLDYILQENKLTREAALFVGKSEKDREMATDLGVEYLEATGLRTNNENTN